MNWSRIIKNIVFSIVTIYGIILFAGCLPSTLRKEYRKINIPFIYEQKLYPVTVLNIKDTVHNNFIITCKTDYDTIIILSHDNHTNKGVDVMEIGETVILELKSLYPIISYDHHVTNEAPHNYCGFEFMPWSFGNKQLYLSKDLDGLNVKKDYSRYYKVDVALTERTDTLLQKLQTPNEKKDNNDRNP